MRLNHYFTIFFSYQFSTCILIWNIISVAKYGKQNQVSIVIKRSPIHHLSPGVLFVKAFSLLNSSCLTKNTTLSSWRVNPSAITSRLPPCIHQVYLGLLCLTCPTHHLIVGVFKKEVENEEILFTDFESQTSEIGIKCKVFYHISQQSLKAVTMLMPNGSVSSRNIVKSVN